MGLLVLATALAWLATIRPGHDWGGDFSLYLRHASNLAEGRPYGDVVFINNPSYQELSPISYPPVFPALLAPFVAAWGLDMDLLKIPVILCFCGALLGLWALARARLPDPAAAAVVAVVAANPYLWFWKDHIKPEFLFVALCLWALVAARALAGAPARGAREGWLAVGVGALLYLAYGTRSVGILLAPAALGGLIWARRRIDRAACVAALTLGAGLLWQNLAVRTEGSYQAMFFLDPAVVAENARRYTRTFAYFWQEVGGGVRWVYFVGVGLAAVGLLRALWRPPRREDGAGGRWRAVEAFTVVYVAIVLVWPHYQVRFLIPLYVLAVLYAAEGAMALGVRLPGRARTALALIACAVFLTTSASRFTRVDAGPIQEGVALPETQAFFDFARSTAPDSVWIFSKPRVLSLFTDRRAAAWHRPADDADLLGFFDRIGVDYVVLARWWPPDQQVLEPLLLRHRSRFAAVFENRHFLVLRRAGG